MKLLAWNLNHKASERRLKPSVVEAIKTLAPDVLILTEYAHGASRAPLVDSLAGQSLSHFRVSHRLSENNQVLIASASRIEVGDLVGPISANDGGVSNFLHVRLPDTGLEIVGLRVPAYEKSYELRDYWAQLAEIVRRSEHRPILFIGDMNADPSTAKRIGDRHLASLQADGWQIPHARGEWSYASGTRVDHAILSPRLLTASAEYIAAVQDLVLAGRTDPRAISDHAALLVEFKPPQSAALLLSERFNQ